MNRRQLEGLAAGGALDGLEPNRAAITANADLLIGIADAAERERSSGQGGLFGGEDAPSQELRLQPTEAWPRSEQMAKERENFGFYFSAHPVQQYRIVASGNGARTYQSLMEAGAPKGGRAAAVMAAMVEKVNKGRTKRGADFIRADFSDQSGQFSAACFEESLVEQFETWAQEGTCLLLNVELDSPNPDEPPRVTIRGGRPLDEVKGSTRMILTLDVANEEALQTLSLELQKDKEAEGEVVIRLLIDEHDNPTLNLGGHYKLGGELAERLQDIEGLERVELKPLRGRASLKLVA